MDRSLVFYRDTIGFKMVRDEVQDLKGTVLEKLCKDSHERRRVVTLYWKLAKGSTFLVLSEYGDCASTGEPLKLDQIGIHHFGLWVEDLTAIYNELEGRGVKSIMPITSFTTIDGNFRSAMFLDPDGTFVQLDELLNGGRGESLTELAK